ncbi:MAG: ATP-binding cassette domain-containing protein [Spirochaetes bacterium]|nr:ATP-binding cassette domain-containing protein [Spirochaetota bacterium]
MANEIIQCQHVGFSAGGTTILHDLHAAVPAGEVLFIAGKSGCGKSTIMRIMAGLNYPTSGDVLMRGLSLRKAFNHQLMANHAQNGYVFQDNALISNLTIFDNIALPLRYNERGTEAEIREQVDKILETFDLVDDRMNRPAALSMGEMKMAALARAVITKPTLLFMDEPIASLDRVRVEMVKEEVRVLRQTGTTFVIIAHEADFADEFATRIWYMDKGRLLNNWSAEELGDRKRKVLEDII